jgi:hypothetical protein
MIFVIGYIGIGFLLWLVTVIVGRFIYKCPFDGLKISGSIVFIGFYPLIIGNAIIETIAERMTEAAEAESAKTTDTLKSHERR